MEQAILSDGAVSKGKGRYLVGDSISILFNLHDDNKDDDHDNIN